MTHARLLLVAVLLSIAVRGALVLTKPIPVGDENSYIEIADSLASGRGYGLRVKPTYYPPLYPLCVFAVRSITGDGFLATRILFVLFGPLLVLSAYRLTRVLYSARIAVVAAAFAAVFPSLTGLAAYWGQSETLYVSLSALGVAEWVRGSRGGGSRAHLAAGTWLALAVLTRTEGLALVATLLVLALVRPRSWPRTALVVLLPVVLAVGARSVINLQTFGRFTPDVRLVGFLGGGITKNVGAFKAAVESGELAREGADRARTVGTAFSAKLMRNGLDLLRDGSYVFPPLLLLPAMIGLFGRGGRRRRFGHLLVAGMVLATVGFVMVAFVKASYLATLGIAFLPWTAVGCLRLDRWLRRRWGRFRGRTVTAVVFALLVVLIPVQPLRLHLGGRLPVEYYRAELWIRSHAAPDALVFCDSENLGANTRRDSRTAGGWTVAEARAVAARLARPVLLLVGERSLAHSPRLSGDAKTRIAAGEIAPLATFTYKGFTAWVVTLREK